MKIDVVQIKDESADKYFMFMKQFTGVCAQGDTKEEAFNRLKDVFGAFIDRIKQDELNYSDTEYSF